MPSSTKFEVRAAPSYSKKQKGNKYASYSQGEEVFFLVDIYELFGIDIDTPGIKTCLNKAFQACKKYVPFDTGLTLRSFTQMALDNHRIRYFFDKNKIVGQTRKGKVVEDYYVVYISESAKNYSWLTRVIYEYYEVLFDEVKKMINKNKKPTPPKEERVILQQEFKNYFVGEYLDNKLKRGLVFLQKVRNDYKSSKEENDRIIKEREEHRRRQREQYLALKKQLKEAKK